MKMKRLYEGLRGAAMFFGLTLIIFGILLCLFQKEVRLPTSWEIKLDFATALCLMVLLAFEGMLTFFGALTREMIKIPALWAIGVLLYIARDWEKTLVVLSFYAFFAVLAGLVALAWHLPTFFRFNQDGAK